MRNNWFVKHGPMCVITILIISFVSQGRAEVHCQDFLNPPYRVCESGIPSHLIHIAAINNSQFQSQWCWAACISMVFNYYGHPIGQERLVTEAYGSIVNMPAEPWTILSILNKEWVDDNGNIFTCISSPGSTDIVKAANDLAANMPLIIGTLGHAVVLTRLEYMAPYVQTPWGPQLGFINITSATVRDPWPGRGRRDLSIMEWANISFAVQIRIQ